MHLSGAELLPPLAPYAALADNPLRAIAIEIWGLSRLGRTLVRFEFILVYAAYQDPSQRRFPVQLATVSVQNVDVDVLDSSFKAPLQQLKQRPWTNPVSVSFVKNLLELKLLHSASVQAAAHAVAILAADSSANANVVLDAVTERHVLLRRETNPVASAAKLLPVVYANLELQRIPDPDLYTNSTVHPRVLAAVYAMEFMHFCSFRLTSAVTRELWPRLWAWAQFIDNHESLQAKRTSSAPKSSS
ncbi:hypothetical protein DFH06DRAFT_1143240 [Mycena polygramma]|nr:hypothetical protein DFH06DRAFT_1143240 [Mycena polygramma]